jgi:ornithine cyclodeaminase
MALADALHDDDVWLVRGEDVAAALAGRELEAVAAVAHAYQAHRRGQTVLPHSVFLRPPGDERNRIIALPAYLGDGVDLAGLKWVSSFPDNVAHGIDRASALVVLNSPRTGRPFAVLEGSLISAQRTAASAALAAKALSGGAAPEAVGLVGAGVINRAIVRHLRAVLPGIRRAVLYDIVPERLAAFAEQLARSWPAAAVTAASGIEPVLEQCPLVSYATTAIRPHVADLSRCPPGSVHLHVSLRDLTPEAILSCDNVVDDPDHVCRAQTSVHLAEQLTGGRDFIRCSLGEILVGTAPAKHDAEAITVFSPFGLGILDLAVAKLALERALEQGRALPIRSFFAAAGAAR